jgi:hypothetical protein
MALFDVFLPLSNEQFLKRDFFDSFNGWRLPSISEGVFPERDRAASPEGDLRIGGTGGWGEKSLETGLPPLPLSCASGTIVRAACQNSEKCSKTRYVPTVKCITLTCTACRRTLASHAPQCDECALGQCQGYPGAHAGRCVGGCLSPYLKANRAPCVMGVMYAHCASVKYSPFTCFVFARYSLACSSDQKKTEFRQ